MSDKPSKQEFFASRVKTMLAFWEDHPEALAEVQRAILGDAEWARLHAPPPRPRGITVGQHIAYQDAADNWVRHCRRHLPRDGRPEAAELLAMVEAGFAPLVVRLLAVSEPGAMMSVIHKRLAQSEEEMMPLIEALGFPHPPKRPG